MLAGDFTAFASPACHAGRQIALRAPFVDNQVNPAAFSPAAVALARRLPSTTDPCGRITFGSPRDSNEWQGLAKVDYQWRANHTIFGRYLHTFTDELPVWEPGSLDANILTSSIGGGDRKAKAQSFTLGETAVLGPSMVNSLRFAYNKSDLRAFRAPYVDAASIGSSVSTYVPGKMVLIVSGGFNIRQSDSVKTQLTSDAFQVTEDLTIVRGRHQYAVGVNAAYWDSYQELNARAGGQFTFNGGTTGLGLADFMTGRLFRLEQGAPGILPMDQTYLGVYAQDTWRLTDRVTINGGLRWEPFFGMNVQNGSISIFDIDNFRRGVKSTVFRNAPAGLIYRVTKASRTASPV